MTKSLLAISTAIIPFIAMAQQTVTIQINSLPAYHASGSAVYLAGSFNGWNPQDEKFKFQNNNGVYSIHLTLDKGKYEYKLTRGAWDKVECGKNGAGIGNRVLTVEGDMNTEIKVEEWQDRFPPKPRVSTASANVCILDTAFLIPQLNRTRRIWIYLPKEYCDDTKKKFPVLYMHDGQNVFDDATSFSGEWGVDDYFDSISLAKCIVIAVDNGGNKRLNEYNPYDNERFGKGEGDLYVDFLVKTLKPFIDKRYRTLKGKENTYIAGSSMGGLISMYAALKYPKTFGGVGVFSPAFWISGTKIFDDIKAKGEKLKSKIYFYGGKLEGETMVPDMLKAFEGMAAVSKSKMTTVIRDEGKHNEATWRGEFPLFYEWMLK
ncbi:MAG TPA: alpha/beta hydrolase-fold protein [Chitinophagaceae bacterium]|jgi:predicted alpha/beta superfamily hydrolase|nr:alpha/beta hydrolase-fold protein [Chitinophagaceae bacterium]